MKFLYFLLIAGFASLFIGTNSVTLRVKTDAPDVGTQKVLDADKKILMQKAKKLLKEGKVEEKKEKVEEKKEKVEEKKEKAEEKKEKAEEKKEKAEEKEEKAEDMKEKAEDKKEKAEDKKEKAEDKKDGQVAITARYCQDVLNELGKSDPATDQNKKKISDATIGQCNERCPGFKEEFQRFTKEGQVAFNPKNICEVECKKVGGTGCNKTNAAITVKIDKSKSADEESSKSKSADEESSKQEKNSPTNCGDISVTRGYCQKVIDGIKSRSAPYFADDKYTGIKPHTIAHCSCYFCKILNVDKNARSPCNKDDVSERIEKVYVLGKDTAASDAVKGAPSVTISNGKEDKAGKDDKAGTSTDKSSGYPTPEANDPRDPEYSSSK